MSKIRDFLKKITIKAKLFYQLAKVWKSSIRDSSSLHHKSQNAGRNDRIQQPENAATRWKKSQYVATKKCTATRKCAAIRNAAIQNPENAATLRKKSQNAATRKCSNPKKKINTEQRRNPEQHRTVTQKTQANQAEKKKNPAHQPKKH